MYKVLELLESFCQLPHHHHSLSFVNVRLKFIRRNYLRRRFTNDCSGAGAPRHDQRKGFYVDTVVDCRYLEMDVVREREGSLNGSEVEGGAIRNGMCRRILRSGAALEAIVRRGRARSVRKCTV